MAETDIAVVAEQSAIFASTVIVVDVKAGAWCAAADCADFLLF